VKITQREEGDAVLVTLTGELDLASSEAVRAHCEQALASRPRRLVIDMRGVAFCDSTGIEALIRARAAAAGQGARLEVVNVHGIALTTLEITGVLPLLTPEPG
jgi:anti-sigma B factor antagonist